MLAHPRPILTQSLRLRTLRLALQDSHSETLALRDTHTLRQGLVQLFVEAWAIRGVFPNTEPSDPVSVRHRDNVWIQVGEGQFI